MDAVWAATVAARAEAVVEYRRLGRYDRAAMLLDALEAMVTAARWKLDEMDGGRGDEAVLR